jgi:putative ABC transport system permease protein
VVVVNESFKQKYFDGGDPLGHRVDSGTGVGPPLWMTIIGVVSDVRERGADQENRPAVYVPYTQTAIAFFQPSEIAIRTSVPPLSIAGALRQAVRSVDPQQPVTLVRSLDEIVDADVADRREVLSLVAAFSAVAVLLAAVGLYSVLSYIVVQSNHEIGVRLAVGATEGAIVGGILSRAAVLAALGVIAGLVCSLAATRLLRTLLYEVSPFDARVYGLAAAAVASVALLSAALPAWRAASTDLLVVLRRE